MRVPEISDDEGNRPKRILHRGSGSVVTWQRAQMVLWLAQDMSVAQIATAESYGGGGQWGRNAATAPASRGARISRPLWRSARKPRFSPSICYSA